MTDMGRRVVSLATLALATVGLVLLLAGGAAAKPSHCAKDCKQDIKSCLALVPNNKSCAGTRAEKKACRKMYATQRKACRGMVQLCKRQNPSLSGTCVPSTTTTSTTTPTTSPLPANTTTTTHPTTTTLSSGSGCLPATGQTTCWDSSGNVVSCAGTGHDGDTRTGAPLSYTDNGDGTVTDNVTGLMWEKQSNGDGSVHDIANTYTWDQAFSTHVATLNGASFAGHTDWRVPNVRELASIANYENVNPAISPAFNNNCTSPCTVLTCSCTQPYSANFYLSSSTDAYASSRSYAWVTTFNGGDVRGLVKGELFYYVRAVRGGSSCLPATGQTTCWDSSGNVIPCAGTGQDGDLQKGAPLSYTDNGDGTVTDNVTGLMWEKKSNDGSVHDVNNTYTWDQAFSTHVATLNGASFAGHADWRVPNVKELLSIVNYENVFPAVSPAFNNNCTSPCTVLTCSCTAADDYWSSSTDAYTQLASLAWSVDFEVGFTITDFTTYVTDYVRAVRGGS